MSNRTNQSFYLSGLNYRNATTAPGAARKAKNVVLRNGKLTNVSNYNEQIPIRNNNGFAIVYLHKAIDTTLFIAHKEGRMHRVEVRDGQVIALQALNVNANGEMPEVSHFGNTLCFRYKKYDPIEEITYLYYQGRYERFNIGNLLPLNNVKIQAEHIVEDKVDYYGTLIAEVTVEDTVKNIEKQRREMYDVVAKNLQKRGYITGAAYLMFAVRLFDGSIVKPSKIYMLPIEREEASNYQLLSAFLSDNVYSFYTEVSGCKVELGITLPDEYMNNPLVKSIVVFSTRDYPIYDFSRLVLSDYLRVADKSGIPTKYSAPRNLIFSEEAKNSLESPFYELKEIDVKDFNNGYKTVQITSSDYNNIEFNVQYEPDFSAHQITAVGDFEYNNRLHKFGLTTRFNSGYVQFVDAAEFRTREEVYDSFSDSGQLLKFVVYIDCGQQPKTVCYTAPYVYFRQRYRSGTGHSPLCYFIWDNLFTYPDARASRLEVYAVAGTASTLVLSRTLKRVPALNYSYFVDLGQNMLMCSLRTEIGAVVSKSFPAIDGVLTEPNKMNVSLTGNPYDYAPQNSYLIGEQSVSRICDVAVSGIEFSSESFGMYPLTVFTTDGVYLVEQGEGEVLYRKVVKISKEAILKGAKAHSVDGALFFASERGLMSVVGRDTVCVSEILDGENYPEKIPFNTYLKNAEIIYLNYYSEVLVYNPDYEYAYVLSIGSGCWYTRDFKGRRIGSCDVITSNGIADLSVAEGGVPLKPEIILAPFSFGDYAFSRVDTLSLEIDTAGVVSYGFKLWGSDDLKHWYLLGTVANFSRMRRTPRSCRYLKLEIDVSTMTSIVKPERVYLPRFELGAVQLELYSRFSSHLKPHDNNNSY